ncbi:MAG: hypothetical protein AB7J28_06880 [Hyphomonadaceae bacterium]
MADIHSSLTPRSGNGERPSKRLVAQLLRQAELHAEDGRTMLEVQRHGLAGCAAYMAMLASARALLAYAGEQGGDKFELTLERLTLLVGDDHGLARDLARGHRTIEQVDDGEGDALDDAHVRPLVSAAERFVDVVKAKVARGEA